MAIVVCEGRWLRTEAEIEDNTGSIVLLFDGRRGVPGLVPGRKVRAEGTPAPGRSGLVMRNPLYSISCGA